MKQLSTNTSNEEKHLKPDCIIPAKKHSSRLPDKNKLEIAGKPMVLWAIEAACESEIFDTVWVSSDDEDILEIAYDYRLKHLGQDRKALVNPHKRPKRLCYSDTQIRHLVKFLYQQFRLPPEVCVMVPCNPFRTPEDLRAGYELFKKRDANYVMSVVPTPKPPQWAIQIKGGYLTPKTDLKQMQKSGKWYYHDGSFIFFKVKALGAEFDFDFHGTKCLPYYMPRTTVDIDNYDDYLYAKWILEKSQSTKHCPGV